MSSPRVLVSGCAGYVGSVLVGQLLRAGCRVTGVDSLLYDNGRALLGHLGDPFFRFERLDARSPEFLSLADRHDVVVPLAALVGAPLCEKNPDGARSINYKAVADLAARMSPSQRLVYPNTNSGYGQTDGTSEVTEDDPLEPLSVYGRTKCDGEKAALGHPGGASLRLATVFGASPRMRLDLMVNHFVRRLAPGPAPAGGPPHFLIYEPHYLRNFVGVRDVARAFLFMVMRPYLKGAFNLGHPECNLSKWDLAMRVCDVLGRDRSAVFAGNGRDPDQRNYRVSNRKIIEAGFRFTHELDDGIREAAAVTSLLGESELDAMRNV